jgi:hypothetical protein
MKRGIWKGVALRGLRSGEHRNPASYKVRRAKVGGFRCLFEAAAATDETTYL